MHTCIHAYAYTYTYTIIYIYIYSTGTAAACHSIPDHVAPRRLITVSWVLSDGATRA